MASQSHKQTLSARQTQKPLLNQTMRRSLSILEMNCDELSALIATTAESNCLLEVEPLYSAHAEYDAPIPDTQERWEHTKVHLKTQLRLLPGDADAQKAAAFLLEELDERGYLPSGAVDDCVSFGFSSEAAAKGLTLLQSLEPCGIGGRDLTEVLMLQLEPNEDIARAIVSSHLYNVANWDIEAIQNATGAAQADVLSAIGRIKSLNPRPLQNMPVQPVRYVVPELMLSDDGDDLTLTLVRRFPEVRVSPFAARALCECDPQERVVLAEQLKQAQELSDAISRRCRTLRRVAEYIVRYQAGFFRRAAPLRPLTQKQIAFALGLSVSTVCRAVKDQALSYKDKTYFLKELLSPSTAAGASREEIMSAIVRIIDSEPAHMPRSDGVIARLLSSEGNPIPRRTITKYRNALGIPPAPERKK